MTLKAYVAEMLKRHDLLFYPEGGRSYSGELKTAKTGLLHATLQAERATSVIIPVAVAYDLVLEDHILRAPGRRRGGSGRSARELAEMVRYAVGYQSRAFVTFGAPIRLTAIDPHSRRDVLELAHLIRDAHRPRSTRSLPTALFAAAMRPSITRRDLEARIDAIIEELARGDANLGVTSGRQAIEEGAEPLEDAQHHRSSSGRPLPRARPHRAALLRAHASSISSLAPTAPRRPH